MENIRVSVIIPAHNEAGYIRETLEAILNQDYAGEFEVIVVDNASNDNTSEMVQKFGSVKLLREERKGVQFARECGRKEAQGEILAYTDSATIPSRDWLRKGVAHFSHPAVAGVSGPIFYHDLRRATRFITSWTQKIFYKGAHFLVHDVFRRGAVMMGGNSFIRAKALEEISGFDTTIVFYGDDTDTARRLSKVGKILFRNDLVMTSYARRFKRQGLVKTFTIYLINFFWVLIFKKPFSRG